MQSREFIYLNYYNTFLPFRRKKLLANSFEKQLKNAGPKKLSSNLLVHAEHNILVKKKEKKGFINYSFRIANHEKEDIMKKIKYLENIKGITVNEKCTHTIS